jgi:hypothetical protein
VFILYSTKFMICYWSEHCMVWPGLWFVTGQNTVCYDQVYDLLLVKTLCAMTKFMICYWSEHYVTTKFIICYWSKCCMLRPSLWFVTGQNSVCYDQVYDLLLVKTLYVTTKFMICYWSEHCMVSPSLWFVTGQNTVCYDQVYDLLLVRMPYVTISNSYI